MKCSISSYRCQQWVHILHIAKADNQLAIGGYLPWPVSKALTDGLRGGLWSWAARQWEIGVRRLNI